MQILIIGGRYGSPDSNESASKRKKIKEDKMYEFYNSVTRQEFQTALDKGIPIFFFVEANVLSEYGTYIKNRDNLSISYAHVDSINVFKLIDEIYSLKTGNYIKAFERFEHISKWLKEQWSGMFADFIENSKSKIELSNLNSKINELGSISSTLKEYSEAIMRKIQPDDYESIIDREEKRLIEEKGFRLANEDMVRHFNLKYNINFHPQKLYESLVKSRNVEDFLNRIGISKVRIDEFLNEFREPAERDFKDYVERYLKK